MTGTVKKAISLTVIAIILAALIAGNVVASMFAGIITNFFSANSTDFSGEETQQALQQSDELVRTLAEDSIVLLKNQEDSDGEPALPLTEDELKVNLFGFSAYDPSSAASFDGFLMKGIGSGSSTISQNKAITLQGALEENGIEYNTDLEAIYDNFNVGRGGNSGNAYWLDEPEITEEQFQQAEEYSEWRSSYSAAWAVKTSASSPISRRRAPSTPTRPTSRSPIPSRNCWMKLRPVSIRSSCC